MPKPATVKKSQAQKLKRGNAEKFSLELFRDVYKSLQEEYGEDYINHSLCVAAAFFDRKGYGGISCFGSGENMKQLISLLVIHVAKIYAEQQSVIEKRKIETIEVANVLLDNIWQQILKLNVSPPQKIL